MNPPFITTPSQVQYSRRCMSRAGVFHYVCVSPFPSELVKGCSCYIYAPDRSYCSWEPAPNASHVRFYYQYVLLFLFSHHRLKTLMWTRVSKLKPASCTVTVTKLNWQYFLINDGSLVQKDRIFVFSNSWFFCICPGFSTASAWV